MSLPKDPKKPSVFSSEYIMEYYKDVKLEDMDKEDIFHRYIVMGSNEEQNNPEIQKVIAQYGYIEELIDMVDIITDSEVINYILSSNLFDNKNLTLMEGKIKNIKFIEDNDLPVDFNLGIIDFLDKKTNKLVLIKTMCYIPENTSFKDKIEKLKNDTIQIIIENMNDEIKFRCFLITQ